MTRDEAKKFLPIIEAYANGAIIERDWGDSGWATATEFNFYTTHDRYRIKPESKKVPMTYEDFKGMNIIWVTNVIWVRKWKNEPDDYFVVNIDKDSITIAPYNSSEKYSFKELFEDPEMVWSTDRINWHRFEKEVQE